MRRLLFVSLDRLPLWRPDVAVLFGRYLIRMGWTVRWRAVQGLGDPEPEWAERASLAVTRCRWRLTPKLHWLASRIRDVSACGDIVTGRVDAVVVRDDYISLLVVGVAAKVCAVPCFYWMSFLMEDAYVARAQARTGLQRWTRTLYGRVYGFLGGLALRYLTNAIFSQSEAMSEVIKGRIPYNELIVPVHMAVDLESLPLPATKSARADVLTLAYSGVVAVRRGFDRLLDGLALAVRRGIPARLIVVGWFENASDELALTRRIDVLDLSAHIDLKGRMEWALALGEVGRCDVALSPIPNDELYRVASPTKFFEYLATGTPVIATRHPVHEAVRADIDFGYVVDDTPHGFAEGIRAAWREKQEGTLVARADSLRNYAAAKHSYEARAKVVDSTFRAIVNAVI